METARALGAYYTPAHLAEPLCRWALRRCGDSVFDPSCGDGAFLVRAADRLLHLGASRRRLAGQIAGVELNPRALAQARIALPGLPWNRLEADDFFRFAERNLGRFTFDAAVGNPPYLRTQGRPAAAKRIALRLARACGAELNADASSWAPFVAVSSAFVRPGGRLAMVVPREALFVNYTRPLLALLERRFKRVHLAALEERCFDGALVKVALLLCEGEGPGTVRLHASVDPRGLSRLDASTAVPSNAPWAALRIPSKDRVPALRALESPKLKRLTDLAQLFIGVVTGDRSYFILPAAKAKGLKLPRRFLLPAVSKPSHLPGTELVSADANGLGRLLAVPIDYAGGMPALDAYLETGARRGVNRRYKCRTRKPWFSVRRMLPPPDAFLGYLVKHRPRLAANAAKAHSTNNVHRLYLRERYRDHAPLLAAAALNAATMLSIELLGRIGAGGVLKIEPGDASKIRLPDPVVLSRVPGALRQARAIDRELRRGRDAEAFALSDALTAKALGWRSERLKRLRRAQAALRAARLGA